MVLPLALAAALYTPSAQAAPFAYITFSAGVSVIDSATNRVIAVIPISEPADGIQLLGVTGIAMSPDGGHVYVTYCNAPIGKTSTGSLFVIATSSNTVVARIPLGIAVPVSIATSPNGSFIYVADQVGKIWVIAAATTSVVASIPVIRPTWLAVTPDGGYLYVSGGSVSVIATATNTVVAAIPLGGTAPAGGQLAITPDGAYTYVCVTYDNYPGFVAVIANATKSVVASIPIARPSSLAITPDGSFAYVTDATYASVSVIATATNTLGTTMAVNNVATVAITPNGTFAYLTCYDRISVIDLNTKMPVASIPTAPGSRWTVFTPVNGVQVPFLGISATHSGNFTRGQSGAAYAVTVSNAPWAASTNGTVTVTEKTPPALTLASMNGAGWTCPGTAPNNCIRADALSAGSSYPVLNVIVNVASDAPPQSPNEVIVSGGGSASAGTMDFTTVRSVSGGAPVRADFDGNGVPDVVWQNERSRQLVVDYYGGPGGATVQGWEWLYPGYGAAGWHVAAIADFNQDGAPDLVWQDDTTRHVTIHYYGGTGGATDLQWNWLYSGTGGLGWHVVAAADFDGNGVPDLIWQNDTTRQVVVHYYGGPGGATDLDWAWLYPGFDAAGWHIAAAADFNGDGVPDLVWQNDATSQVTVHYYGGPRGATDIGWNWLYPGLGAVGWHVGLAADFNGDGVPDLVWQNNATSQLTVHYYGGPGGATDIGWNWLYESLGAAGWSVK